MQQDKVLSFGGILVGPANPPYESVWDNFKVSSFRLKLFNFPLEEKFFAAKVQDDIKFWWQYAWSARQPIF